MLIKNLYKQLMMSWANSNYNRKCKNISSLYVIPGLDPGIFFLCKNRSNSIYSIAGLELFDDVVGYYTVNVDDVVSYIAAGLVDE